jgi:hypothetical protein
MAYGIGAAEGWHKGVGLLLQIDFFRLAESYQEVMDLTPLRGSGKDINSAQVAWVGRNWEVIVTGKKW